MIFFRITLRFGASDDRIRTQSAAAASFKFSDSCSNKSSSDAALGPVMMNAAGIFSLHVGIRDKPATEPKLASHILTCQ